MVGEYSLPGAQPAVLPARRAVWFDATRSGMKMDAPSAAREDLCGEWIEEIDRALPGASRRGNVETGPARTPLLPPSPKTGPIFEDRPHPAAGEYVCPAGREARWTPSRHCSTAGRSHDGVAAA